MLPWGFSFLQQVQHSGWQSEPGFMGTRENRVRAEQSSERCCISSLKWDSMASPQHPTKAVWQWHSLSRNTHNASVTWHKHTHTHARTMCQPSVRQYVNTSQTRVLNVAAALSGDSQRNCSLCFYLWTTLGPGKLELDTSTFAISHFKGVVRYALETERSTFNCDGNSDSRRLWAAMPPRASGTESERDTGW